MNGKAFLKETYPALEVRWMMGEKDLSMTLRNMKGTLEMGPRGMVSEPL